VLYYPQFYDWKGVRRTFKGIEDFATAKAELARLKQLNAQHYEFDEDKRPAATLFPWADKYLELNKQN